MSLRIACAFVLLGMGPGLAQVPDAVLLAGACQGCHGAAGQGFHGIPQIKDAHSRADFVAMMQAFRANQREATVMGRIARGYSEAEITALAVLYARAQ
ncbi:c-type cytochrome [Sediminicoccus sp. KRV36]|uniref:c-type cytochrome n=1 Tax=Sediminicoccus sp. KRV36 TaxID=3133721 RepID=UPI00200D7114|nr:c-type cytochrome [Sediminicoccus rosea]UPY35577.1 hypothetical protein LHU95_15265 [Sediminicoccus rosea]